jgi:hypothetical protein
LFQSAQLFIEFALFGRELFGLLPLLLRSN